MSKRAAEPSNAETDPKKPCLKVEEWGLTVTDQPKEPGFMSEILKEKNKKRRSIYLEDMPADWPGDISKGLGFKHLMLPGANAGEIATLNNEMAAEMIVPTTDSNEMDMALHTGCEYSDGIIEDAMDDSEITSLNTGNKSKDSDEIQGTMDDGEMSMEDISLGDLDPYFVPPVSRWLFGFDEILQTCKLDEMDLMDLEKLLTYIQEESWVPDAIPNSFKEPEGFRDRITWFMNLVSKIGMQGTDQVVKDTFNRLSKNKRDRQRLTQLVLSLVDPFCKYLGV